ncbi:MAG TPA: hypothetical protein PLM14_00305 [Candidatus Hydrogenedentes bacterium]|nr:hypothetical protein [Candidatus Hydrogenedentota bacterium]HQE81404.1 hypothetical protein [Candidatus Hydrogenedentota bacterium]HQH54490.1 hypothetical protein [Candidatus Hydrogenedentota bacterium]HQM48147.1 hypothetical protein [Candidatus Hydrogenedentota bacterium]
MNHVRPATRITLPRVAASTLEVQQKVEIFGEFAAALGTLGEAIGTWLGLR